MSDSPALLARARDTRYAGWLPRDAADVGTGETGTPEQGAWTRIQVRVDAVTRRIVAAVFKAVGDSAVVASASLVAERLQEMPVDQGRALQRLAIAAELQLPIERAGVAGRAVDAAIRAIDDWQRKQDANAAARTR